MATALIGALCLVAFDLSRLQSGLETPTVDVLSAASRQSGSTALPKPITSYDRFETTSEGGLTVAVYAREQPEAVANVLLVHGAASGAWAWEYYFQRLPDSLNLYALSWRGHFDSATVDDADSFAYVRDQRSVLAGIHERNRLPVHVVGHSYGGATSVMMAASPTTRITSLQLLAPVVPLDYSLLQSAIVPIVAPYFIRSSVAAGNRIDGTYGGMFIAKNRMKAFHERYAGKPYSIERPSLIARDGVSLSWQVQLQQAYEAIARQGIPISIYVAKYDNVVVPRRQRELAKKIRANLLHLKSGHYIPLDVAADRSALLIAKQISKQITTCNVNSCKD